MDHYLYKCHYCGKEYVPNRRHKQKFCTASCRSKDYRQRKKKGSSQIKKFETENQKEKMEGMSLAGIGNSAAGILIFEMLKKLLTSEENKSASKGQAQEIITLLNQLKERHHLITNLPPRNDGALPYYDIQTRELTYRLPPSKVTSPSTALDSFFR